MADNARNQLEAFIDEKIKEAYGKYGEFSTASVRVHPDKIEIWFNTEKPYLHMKFWDLLEDVSEAIRSRIAEEGYETKHESSFMYSLLNWTYHRK